MSSTANKGTAPHVPLAEEPKPRTNADRKAEKCMRQITHKQQYIVSLYAQYMIKIKELQDELASTGYPPMELIKPDWEDEAMWADYARLGNYKG